MNSFRNWSLQGFLGIAFLGLAASGQVFAATPVALDATNLELLRGRWEGTLEIVDDRFDVKKEIPVVMEIIGKSDFKSSLVVGDGEAKMGRVVIKDGKIAIGFMGGSH